MQFSKTEASETLLGRRAITGIPDRFSAPALKVAYHEPAMSDPIERYGESFSNEALQDLRSCGKCQTMSYLRKGFCINMHCADLFYVEGLKEPSTRLWQRGPDRGKKTQYWTPATWRDSGYADAVYQNKLQSNLQSLEAEIGEMETEKYVQIHDSASEEEEFLQREEKEKEAANESFTPKDLETARSAYQTVRLQDKAEKALARPIKLEKRATPKRRSTRMQL